MKKTDKQEILVAIQTGNQKLSGQIDFLAAELLGMKDELLGMKGELAGTHEDIKFIDIRLKRVESQMVTKEYLDEKLANQYSDIIGHVRRKVPEWVKS